MGGVTVKRVVILIIGSLMLSSVIAHSQTSRRGGSRQRARAAAAEKRLAEIQAGRQRIATEIKALTQFLYLLGGVSKSIESAERANRNREASALSAEQIEKNRASVKASVRNVREGLDKLEMSFRSNPALTNYYPYVAAASRIGETAEVQAGANKLDEAGRTLINAVSQLTDALVTQR
jgi:hypothetical protein